MRKLCVLMCFILLAGCGKGVAVVEESVTEELFNFLEKDEYFEGQVMKEGDWYPIEKICHFARFGYVIEYAADTFEMESSENGEKLFVNDNIYISIEAYGEDERARLTEEYPFMEEMNGNEEVTEDFSDDSICKYVTVEEGNGIIYIITRCYPNNSEVIEGIAEDIDDVAKSFRLQ